MLKELKDGLSNLILSEYPYSIDKEKLIYSFSFPDESLGDLTTNISFLLSKMSDGEKKPNEISKELVDLLLKNKLVKSAESKGPYVNIKLSDKFYYDSLEEIVNKSESYGKDGKYRKEEIDKNEETDNREEIDKKDKKDKSGKTNKEIGKTIMMEFFHANTHKGIHIGHIRNISIGESLSRVFEFTGNKVIRVNYQGDIGPHVAKCLWGFINLYNKEAPKEKRGVWLGKVYSEASKKIGKDEKLNNEVKVITNKLYQRDREIERIWLETRKWCLEDFDEFYKEFGVSFDELYFESETEGIGKDIVLNVLNEAKTKEVRRDDGAVIADLKEYNLGVSVLITQQGYPLYPTKDIGLAKMKFDKYKNVDESIHVVGREQEFYFKQLFKMFEKIGFKNISAISYHLIYELVMLPEGKMSSRDGTMVLYDDLKNKLMKKTINETKIRHPDWDEDLLNEVSEKITMAGIKFSMLKMEFNKKLIFDWENALNLEGDSGPHLQYTYVRAKGIINKSEKKPKINNELELSESEKKLIKSLSIFPEVVMKSSNNKTLHNLSDYLLNLSADFNKFYSTSKVLNEPKKVEENRLVILFCYMTVIKSGLNLLGIEIVDMM